MNTTDSNHSMKQEELQNRINDAADGLLTESERHQLEVELKSHPELYSDYKDILALPDISLLFRKTESYRDHKKVARIFESIDQIESSKLSFENITMDLFRKYALAASLLILAGISLFSISQSSYLSDDVALEEIFYPEEQSNTEDYVLYLDDLIEP